MYSWLRYLVCLFLFRVYGNGVDAMRYLTVADRDLPFPYLRFLTHLRFHFLHLQLSDPRSIN